MIPIVYGMANLELGKQAKMNMVKLGGAVSVIIVFPKLQGHVDHVDYVSGFLRIPAEDR